MGNEYITAADARPHEPSFECVRNSSAVAYVPNPVTLHGLFEAQECRTPSAVAVVCGDGRLTYRQLNERSQAVARALARAGVGQGSFVGLCVERSLDMAVGLLGIVKAGGAFVPLDPLYPADRLAFMAADTEIQVLLTARNLVSELPQSQARVIHIDEVPEREPDYLDEQTEVEVGGDDLAYVIYTSGSTGRPKGVMIEHAAVVNTINDMNRRFAVGPSDCVLSLSSYGFDLTVYDLFGLWAVGGTAVISEPADARQPSNWAELLRRHQVTIWNTVPASMAMLVADQAGRSVGALDSVRLVLLSGDCLPTTLPDRVRAINPQTQIVNLYGATEASIWSVVHPVGSCDPRLSCVPLGTAMDNQSFHVLNGSLEVCPPGETGQLYLGGMGLARGYLRRAELTAERFITNPLGHVPGARLYATGDFGRMRDDGTVEFLGRTDGQVKINGFRVETGEIEAVLCRHPAIREAVVVAKEHLDHKQLVAYIVPSRQPAATAAELRDFLRQSLPYYMVPRHFVMRDCLPLTDNNKVDRAALALDSKETPSATINCSGATNEVERRLVSIFREGFGLEMLTVDDNFFDLDGDSLLAAGLFARIEQEFGVTLALDVLFERPTVRKLGTLLTSPSPTPEHSAIVTIHAPSSPNPGRVQTLAMETRAGAAPPDGTVRQGDRHDDTVSPASIAYWVQKIGGNLPVIELPTDRPRRPARTYRGAIQQFELPRQVSASLKAVGGRDDASLFVMLLAAFKTLLWRYTGFDDMLVALPLVAENHPDAGESSDQFVGTLALRTDLGGDPPFRELVARVRTTMIDAHKHHDVPFEMLMRELEATGRTDDSALNRVAFELREPARQPQGHAEIVLPPLENKFSTRQFEIALSLVDTEMGLSGSVEYNADLFDSDRIARLIGHFRTLLDGVVADPHERLSALPLLTSVERQQLLAAWNATQSDYPKEICIHDLFEAQAKRTPEATALTFEGRQWSYRELNVQANRLAHHLQTLGVGPDIPVAICLERSTLTIIGVLAILKAGGAYVPLDPAYPQDGLSFVLQDTEARVLLTERRLSHRFGNIQAVYLDEVGPALRDQPESDPVRRARPDDMAYIIYTSGSTGQPKGVVVEHRNAVHSTWNRMQYYSRAPKNFALIPSIAFDASVAAIFWTLSQGGTLCLPSHGAEQDIVRLGEWIQQQRVTHWLSVPSVYNLLLEEPVERLASLQTVVLGGELCPQALVQRHFSRLESADLYNEYGPTEGTVWSTVFQCTADDTDRPVPIGRPISNVRLYVLDQALNPVPIGVPGELYLAGEGVARGYYRRVELTAQRFVPNPFETVAGGRLYRTGDLVRYLPDSNLEFLGRIDNQVKLRGHRIELGQIEATLRSHEGISAAAVLVRETEENQKHLVAYLVGIRRQLPSPRQLRRWLRNSLPDYMIPAYFVTLDSLPLTPNGKVDHRALPMPDRSAAVRQLDYVAPCDEVESRLTKIWEHVFDLRPIGVSDDFFDLGGDSLLAVGLITRIEQEFGTVLSPDVLLERPTVRLLSALLRDPPSGEAKYSAVNIRVGDTRPPLFCLPGIGGNVLEFHALTKRFDSKQSVYGLRPAGLDDGQVPHSTIAEMAAHAISQMRTVQPRGPYHLVGYSLGGVVAFEMACQLQTQGETVALLAMLDSRLWSPPVRLSILQKIRLHWKNLYHNDNRGRWRYLRERGRMVAERIRRRSLRHAEDDIIVGLDLSPSSRKVARVHWHALHNYQPHVYDGAITLFVAQCQPEIAMSTNWHDPTLGWSRWTTRPVQLYQTAGTHAEILHRDELQALATQLGGCRGTPLTRKPRTLTTVHS